MLTSYKFHEQFFIKNPVLFTLSKSPDISCSILCGWLI